MNIAGIKLKRKQLILLGVLILGLIALVYLIQHQQIFKGRANVDPSSAFSITTSDPDSHVTATSPNTYSTDTLNIKIKLTDPNLLNH